MRWQGRVVCCGRWLACKQARSFVVGSRQAAERRAPTAARTTRARKPEAGARTSRCCGGVGRTSRFWLVGPPQVAWLSLSSLSASTVDHSISSNDKPASSQVRLHSPSETAFARLAAWPDGMPGFSLFRLLQSWGPRPRSAQVRQPEARRKEPSGSMQPARCISLTDGGSGQSPGRRAPRDSYCS